MKQCSFIESDECMDNFKNDNGRLLKSIAVDFISDWDDVVQIHLS